MKARSSGVVPVSNNDLAMFVGADIYMSLCKLSYIKQWVLMHSYLSLSSAVHAKYKKV